MIRFQLGLIFSTSGPYAALGQSALCGASMAIDDLRTAGVADIEPVLRDPGGDPARYESATADVLGAGAVRHVVGAITSWSRKDMIPVLERHGGLLWYPCPYEGFESNDHVVYLGTAPNHHMLPLIDRVAETGARRAYLIGSNYVWGWETLRLARERLGMRLGEVAGERYIPLGSTDFAHVMKEIEDQRPDVIVNSLIGPSNVAFMRALGERPGWGSGEPGRVVSCNQTEVDLADLGPAGDGMLSAASFFEELADGDFRRRVAARAPNGRVSSFLATSYAAVQTLAEAVARAGTDDPRAVFRAASGAPTDTVLGPLDIDAVTRHAALRPHLALAGQGDFHVIQSAEAPVPADPYLTNMPAGKARPFRPDLRIVQ
ncbi:transporter substrate-binding protein [Tranquillimonas alkanivorans]|uniref:Amino acid/amide ABC transporter substrate-binding protein, HAAT family n=1 Tax=Tranquillimonas alkanivorans TaxID=441119 RepID=A0A1I5N8J5_9RHOB|nr:transporter substrate-binding protein [Tranquillimonas alkanivorans]SFP18169.1 amino acid/amide ABC transporter substrate-binding protein, HAAT family [Tranquillimonas alkanivorans]